MKEEPQVAGAWAGFGTGRRRGPLDEPAQHSDATPPQRCSQQIRRPGDQARRSAPRHGNSSHAVRFGISQSARRWREAGGEQEQQSAERDAVPASSQSNSMRGDPAPTPPDAQPLSGG